ncbi:GNAT family N-acetyltransferase [Nocardioides sp. HM23]|uniref:GNAT family N-acetyltransferase n=1 Tax=Nocardioides bizhenqiangii TaxID=3095076 RepID=UPI002ACAB4B8|nr:GNAT family N-acetyltransferase [Nocardioides sp. HM23]MDZ5620045.1 GNAT family N-acetyltransferase [Nocardioides sp. HM23]
MFLRIRTRLPETPGALATLAGCLGDAEVNILALQIYPDLGTVTDDLVVEVPDTVSPGRLLELAESAGCTEVTVAVCSEQELQDQPTRWLSAVRRLIDDPARIHAELTGLLGPRVNLSPTEQVRAAALTDIAAAMGPPATPTPDPDAVVAYDQTTTGVRARVGTGVIGSAEFTHVFPARPAEGTLEVAPAWRRMGIGSNLLRRLCALAAEAGAKELVLVAPADQRGAAALLAAAGMRGRIRLTSNGLRVHLTLPSSDGSAGPGDAGRSTPFGRETA